MATATVENYVKQLYLLQEQREDPEDLVPVGELAKVIGVVPGTATTMVRTLSEAGLARHEPWSGVRLTDNGRNLALRILRRHRMVELFLVKIMEFDWADVHDEAEELEHVVSEKLVTKMEEMLDHPKVDLHGDPIPDSSGLVVERTLTPLNEGSTGIWYRVGRISHGDENFLNFIQQNGLSPGEILRIRERNDQAGILTLKTASQDSATLALSMAEKIQVEVADP
ncbi:MAG: metal-dependent transcriptional regulator [Verrucomicrobiota bacterium]